MEKNWKHIQNGEAYKEIIESFGINPSEVCVVGDDYENDIKPAQELGCKSVWITKNCNRENEFFVESIEDFLKLNLEEI